MDVENFYIKEMCFLEVRKEVVQIQGVRMGMVLQASSWEKPVLLVVHGGPGMPEFFLEEKFGSGLCEEFVVVWWDQRGAGLSFSKETKLKDLTVSKGIQDVIDVTNYLRERFHKEKIYILAHSFGTFLGIQAIAQAPELYEAYLGVAQVIYQKESEKLAYEYMIEYYKRAGKKRTVRKLLKHDYTSKEYKKMRDSLMHKSGIGTMHDMKSVALGVFFASFFSKTYSFKETVNLWRGRALLRRSELETTKLSEQWNFRNKITKVNVPVYFFSGVYDYTVNYKLVKGYYMKLKAPKKRYYLFEHSAHSPMFEEPERMCNIIKKDILKE